MSVWTDHPIECIADDCLERESIIRSLGRLVDSNRAASPLTVGIFGDWGSGKTSVMRAIAHELATKPDPHEKALILWFDAWKYARSEQALWRALLLCVVETLAAPETGITSLLGDASEGDQNRFFDEIDTLRTSLYRNQTITESGSLRVNWASTFSIALDIILRLVGAGLVGRGGLTGILNRISGRDTDKAARVLERAQVVRYREQLTSIEQFQTTLDQLIKREIIDRGLTLYIFVDDLDRCLPEEAVGALEAIKLFLDIKGCVFVLGMDRDVVERGILVRYPPVVETDGNSRLRIDPRQYLDKIIQLPFTLPPLTQRQIGAYLDKLLDDGEDLPGLRDCRSLIELAAPPNPRTLKRILNVLSLLASIKNQQSASSRTETGSHATRIKLLAKVVLMQVLFDAAYAKAVTDPDNLVRLEKAAQDLARGEDMKPLLDAAPKLRLLLQERPWFAGQPSDALWELICHANLTATPPSAGNQALSQPPD